MKIKEGFVLRNVGGSNLVVATGKVGATFTVSTPSCKRGNILVPTIFTITNGFISNISLYDLGLFNDI